MASQSHGTVSPLFLRHDLLIELGRLERAIAAVRAGRPSECAQRLLPLETSRARLFAVLTRVSR